MARRVQMKMILMIPVGLGAQNGAERTAGRRMYLSQNAPFAAPPPTLQHRHRVPVLQTETSDIDGVAFAMLGNLGPGAAVACATGIMRGHFDPADPAAEPANGLGHIVLNPVFERLCRAAIQDRGLGQGNARHRHHAHWVLDSAARKFPRDPLQRFALNGAVTAQFARGLRGRSTRQLSCEDDGEETRPKSGAAVSCPASMIPRRMARVRVK